MPDINSKGPVCRKTSGDPFKQHRAYVKSHDAANAERVFEFFPARAPDGRLRYYTDVPGVAGGPVDPPDPSFDPEARLPATCTILFPDMGVYLFDMCANREVGTLQDWPICIVTPNQNPFRGVTQLVCIQNPVDKKSYSGTLQIPIPGNPGSFYQLDGGVGFDPNQWIWTAGVTGFYNSGGFAGTYIPAPPFDAWTPEDYPSPAGAYECYSNNFASRQFTDDVAIKILANSFSVT